MQTPDPTEYPQIEINGNQYPVIFSAGAYIALKQKYNLEITEIMERAKAIAAAVAANQQRVADGLAPLRISAIDNMHDLFCLLAAGIAHTGCGLSAEDLANAAMPDDIPEIQEVIGKAFLQAADRAKKRTAAKTQQPQQQIQ